MSRPPSHSACRAPSGPGSGQRCRRPASRPSTGAGGCRGAPSCLQRGQDRRETGGSGGPHSLQGPASLGFLCTHTASAHFSHSGVYLLSGRCPEREGERAQSPDHGGRKSPEVKRVSQDQDTFKSEWGGHLAPTPAPTPCRGDGWGLGSSCVGSRTEEEGERASSQPNTLVSTPHTYTCTHTHNIQLGGAACT